MIVHIVRLVGNSYACLILVNSVRSVFSPVSIPPASLGDIQERGKIYIYTLSRV